MSFQSPNHTQTPNDFFDMVPDMGDAELRVTLTMIRNTFGFHRRNFKMGIDELARQSGLSSQGARDGAEAAEKRGNFKRSNPDSKKTAEWELSILNPVDLKLVDLNPVEVEPQAGGGLTSTQLTTVPLVKKVLKKDLKKKGDYLDLIQNMANSKQVIDYAKVQEMLDRMDREFRCSFPRNGNTEVMAKFIIAQEEKGQKLDTFLTWAQRDEFNASRLYEYAENPSKIKIRWAQAFTQESTDHAFLDIGE